MNNFEVEKIKLEIIKTVHTERIGTEDKIKLAERYFEFIMNHNLKPKVSKAPKS